MILSDTRILEEIEKQTIKIEKIKHKFLSEEELNSIDNWQLALGETNQPINLLTLLWCCKEAMFKWFGDGGIDFKDHLKIEKINWEGERGIAHCKVIKEKRIDLTVELLFIKGNCLAWVVTEK
jgi:phosphopantetheinyl transferase (holo-ACP synthase)